MARLPSDSFAARLHSVLERHLIDVVFSVCVGVGLLGIGLSLSCFWLFWSGYGLAVLAGVAWAWLLHTASRGG